MVARELWEFCLRHQIRIRAIHRAGVDNVRADRLSREKYDPTGYRLHPEVFRQINRQFGPHTIDLMADRLNTQLPRFISRFPDPLSSGTDVFRSNLAGENGFAHPPPALIARVASLVHRQRAEVTLVTPNWKGPWESKCRFAHRHWCSTDRIFFLKDTHRPSISFTTSGKVFSSGGSQDSNDSQGFHKEDHQSCTEEMAQGQQ